MVRSFIKKKKKKYVRFFVLRAVSFNQHNMYYRQVSSGWISVLARLPGPQRILASSKMPSSLRSLTIPSDGNGHLHNEGENRSRTRSRNRDSEAIFCRPPTFDPISTLTGGQEDQTLRQEVKGARTHCCAPSVQTFDSPRKRSTHLSSVPPLPLSPPSPSVALPRSFPPRSFRWTQEKRPQVILKNGPSASAVYRATRTCRNSFAAGNALHAHR